MWVVSIDTVLEMKNELFFFLNTRIHKVIPHPLTDASSHILDPLEISSVHLGGNESETGKWCLGILTTILLTLWALWKGLGDTRSRDHTLRLFCAFIACDPDFEKHSSRKRANTDKLNQVNPISYISSSVFPSCSSGVRRVLWLTPQQQFHIR